MSGHVFVVNGKLEHVGADAVIVPTDDKFDVRDYWLPVWYSDPRGGAGPSPNRPEGWGPGGVARQQALPGRPEIWVVDVARTRRESAEQTIDKIVSGVERAVGEMAEAGISPSHRRSNLLIAIPTLGVRGGGLGSIRGKIIQRLLEAYGRLTDVFDVDIVVVALRRADHAAFQSQRKPALADGLDPALLEEAKRLGALAHSGKLALFIGAGASMSAGLPSWDDLLQVIVKNTPNVELEHLDNLNALDTAEYLRRKGGAEVDRVVIDSVGRSRRAGLSHLLLSGRRCREVVTTNYDQLFELAAGKRTAVLPWSNADGSRRWLLKMHGSVEIPNSIVLSRSDFVQYDTVWGPTGAVVESLLLTKHLLVVGASMTDDNFLRLAHQVSAFLGKHGVNRKLGTVLTLKPQPVRKELFNREFDYIATSTVERSRLGDQNGPDVDESRALSIFLDAIGAFATTDASFLLDQAYESLLKTPEERALAGDFRALADKVRSMATRDPDGRWSRLERALREFGA